MIGALQSHRRAYADFLGTQDANLGERLGERLGNTDAAEKLLAEFKLFAQKVLLVDVAYVFGRQKPNPAALTLFLPKGRKEYGGATLLTLPALLERVASLPVTYKDDLGGALAARAAQLKQAYQAVCQTQGASKGEVQGDSKAEKALRKAGARQLKLNLLDWVKLHIDEPDTVRALYDPKIFTQPTKAAQPKV